MHSGEKTVLQLDRIFKKYTTKASFFGTHGKDVIALNKVSLKVFKKEIFGLVGESGSGKTTVGRLIARLERPEQGSIYIDGNDISNLKGKESRSITRNVQLIFQDPYQSLNPQLSIFDTVLEPLIIHKIGNNNTREEHVIETMKMVGLSPPHEYLHRYPHQLSGGQRQRVAIARTMVLRPEFVIADEPTSMLDASISAQIFNILLEMREKLNVTFLFITHSLAAARYLCDRVAVIYKGNVMEIGGTEEVLQRPRHPYTQALIDALPKFGTKIDMKRYGSLLKKERDISDTNGCPFYRRCAFANKTKCDQEIPQLEESGPSHLVACFYA